MNGLYLSEDHLTVYTVKCPICKRENAPPKIMEGVCRWCNYQVTMKDLSETGMQPGEQTSLDARYRKRSAQSSASCI